MLASRRSALTTETHDPGACLALPCARGDVSGARDEERSAASVERRTSQAHFGVDLRVEYATRRTLFRRTAPKKRLRPTSRRSRGHGRCQPVRGRGITSGRRRHARSGVRRRETGEAPHSHCLASRGPGLRSSARRKGTPKPKRRRRLGRRMRIASPAPPSDLRDPTSDSQFGVRVPVEITVPPRPWQPLPTSCA